MTPSGNHVPGETTIELGGGSYVVRLPVHLAAELQTQRALTVTFPDGSTARRPKPLGLIWREHADSGEYDPIDSVAIITLGLLGGAKGVGPDQQPVEVNRAVAEKLVRDYVTGNPGDPQPMPLEDIWQLALRILVAVCQGYVPELGAPGPKATAGEADTPTSTSPSSSQTASSGESPSPTPET